MAIQVAVIGAGSLTFTRKLVRDLLAVPEFAEARFAFTDIDRVNLDRAVQLCRKDIADNGLGARVTGSPNRRRSLENADYVINCTRIGGLKAFKTDIDIPLKDVDIVCAGLNHQTWYIQVLYRGQDWTGRLLEGFERHPRYSKTEPCRIDVLRRIGYYSTESNRHLSECLPWYRKDPARTRKWVDESTWIGGETGGYLRVCTEGRNEFNRDFAKWMKAPASPITAATRSHHHGSYIIEALETGRTYRGHFIVPNQSAL